MEITKKDKITVLIEEYKVTNNRIETFLNSQIRFFWQGLALIFGILAIYKNQGFPEIILFLPFLIILYLGLFFYHYQRCLTNQFYKAKIEERINTLLGDKFLFYFELGFTKVEKTNWFRFFNIFTYAVILGAAVFLMWYVIDANKQMNSRLVCALISITIVSFFFLLICVIRIGLTNNKIIKTFIPEILNENEKSI